MNDHTPPKEDLKPWSERPVTGGMLKAAIQLVAGRSNSAETAKKILEDFEKLMDSGDPQQANELLKPEKRARGRPRTRPPEDERKHRDLGTYNLFVMKAQNVAGTDVKNHRAFMALIGTFWKAMDQETRDNFNNTYKGLLDHLNDAKKQGLKFDFAHELKLYERDNELDTIAYFRGFMQQVKALPLPETKQEREARLTAGAAIPAPVDEEDMLVEGHQDAMIALHEESLGADVEDSAKKRMKVDGCMR